MAEELTAIYQRERHRFVSQTGGEDTVIIECHLPTNGQLSLLETFESVSIKTQAEPTEFTPQLSYRFYGHWSTYTNKRTGKTTKQFVAKTFVRCQPHGQAGVIRYLLQAPNIGQATARKLWQKFQGDAVRILRESPDVATAAVDGHHFSEDKAEAAAKWLKSAQALEDCTIDLIDLLGGKGFPKTTPKKAVERWGNKAYEFIKQSPYHLMAFRGCGFLRCDQLYMDLGHDPRRLKRQAWSVWYTLARDTEGHTWHPTKTVESGLRDMIGGQEVRPVPAARLAKRAGLIDTRRDETNELWLADNRKAGAERKLAEIIAQQLQHRVDWPSIDSLDVSNHQREELAKALGGCVGCFGGSPGTGKTYSTARLIKLLLKYHGREKIAVAAPTGKAAVRITEVMASYGVDIQATTIHRLLGVASNIEGVGWSFQHDDSCPLHSRFVFVDESSMLDTNLAYSLMNALAPGAHILFIGDINQLPPVGHGAPLRDIIAAGVPSGELREIHRNSGAIVQACADMRDGRRFDAYKSFDFDSGQNLVSMETRNGKATCERIIKAINNIKQQKPKHPETHKVIDPIWDVQVIVAVNRKSDLSRHDLNKQLQAELNPSGLRAGNNPFRVGDKIVCLKNGLLPLVNATGEELVDDEDGDGLSVFVANGELGEVTAVQEKIAFAKFTGPDRLVKIPRGTGEGKEDDSSSDEDDSDAGTGCSFDLGYAISCHKSQGSEWPVVIVALDEYPGARRVCSREWLYTACSRGKLVVFLVGKLGIARSMTLRRALPKRKTFLKELILERMKSHYALYDADEARNENSLHTAVAAE